MKDIKLTQDDIATTEQGVILFVEGKELLAQWAKNVVSYQQGNWFCDLSLGLPWHQVKGSKPFDFSLLRGLVARLLSRKGLKIDKFNVTKHKDREITFEVEVKQ